MKSIIKKLIKNLIPLNFDNYEMDLTKEFHVMQGNSKSYFKKDLKEMTFNELCILFKTDKATTYENLIYDTENKKYSRSLIVGHNYAKYYSNESKHLIKNLIEIGSYKGASSLVFAEYFNESKVYCLDIDFKRNLAKHKNIKKILVDQSDSEQINQFISSNQLNNNIDLVSDDGAHQDKHILVSFENIFPHLNEGRNYFIEDITEERTPEVYNIFIKKNIDKLKCKNLIFELRYFKSNVSSKTQSNANQCYMAIVTKK